MSSGEKMSKSTGETVDPLSLVEQRGVDAFRYFVMREMTVGQDAEFSLERFESRYKTDLGNDLGNLVSRLLHMTATYENGIVPRVEIDGEFEQKIQSKFLESKGKCWNFLSLFSLTKDLSKFLFLFDLSINMRMKERHGNWQSLTWRRTEKN